MILVSRGTSVAVIPLNKDLMRMKDRIKTQVCGM